MGKKLLMYILKNKIGKDTSCSTCSRVSENKLNEPQMWEQSTKPPGTPGQRHTNPKETITDQKLPLSNLRKSSRTADRVNHF